MLCDLRNRKLKSRKADSVDEARFNVQDYVNEKTSRIPSCPQCMWVEQFGNPVAVTVLSAWMDNSIAIN